jgi:hypothetical protein
LTTSKRGAQSFTGTYFGAALDAARQYSWPHQSFDGDLTPRFTTQVRQMVNCALLLGIQPGLHERVREQTAQIFSIGGQRLYDSQAIIEAQPGYHGLGKAICNVLDALEPNTFLYERLTEAGSGICLWPFAHLWDPHLNILRRTRFHRIGTRSPPD